MKDNSVISSSVQDFQFLVNRELNELEECVKTVHDMLDLAQYYEHLRATLEGKKIDYIAELLGETSLSKIFFKFPKTLEASLFITLYAFLESRLVQLCEIVRVKGGYYLGISDVKGKGITAAQIYIKKAARLPFPDNKSSDWDDINSYRRVRNCIVHQGSNVRKDDEKLKNAIGHLVTKRPLVKLVGENIELSNGFCLEFVQSIGRFVNGLFDAIIGVK